ncbi:glutathione synthase [Halarcobacter ebronensis]|uniref:Glutathione synthetase n=1 Tax=Halarcobacter ebronensis TaxID=1462615 RepID=A0A4Q1AQ59_9BACT|nr:glutathione synthase [Halarcobacter ebronensis]QKF82820.1 glutathione synthetase [Halarcobacter ebronensis]RXJ69668.1 glutathione synthase [Halarcobacter ebronensis]RXK06842.1 glutathione synthase [Halarcobacter ebronensis]
MRVAFIIENWANIEPLKSTTLAVIKECMTRGHRVAILYTHDLTVRNNTVHGFAKMLKYEGKIPDSVTTFYKKTTYDIKLVALHAFDCIMIRKDPPISPLVFNFLDSVKNETVIINDVDGIRKANNKLYTTTFHDPGNSFLPKTHVSGSKKYIKKIIEESNEQKMILKPLDGSGGRGVIVLEKNAMSNINSLLDFYIDESGENYVILQEYIAGAENGDVRVIMLNGKAIGAYHRKPAEGDHRANIQTGGSAHKYTLTESQKKICSKVGKKLIADGIFFAGLDIIGDKILEVNVLNPGGITNINKLSKVKLHQNVVDFLEEKVHEKVEKRAELEYLLKKLNELRE